MILSDIDLRLRGPYLIDPFDPDLVQPASIDLHLDEKILIPVRYRNIPSAVLDLRDINQSYMYHILNEESSYTINPHEFILGSTAEQINTPNDLVGRIEGKSSIGRLGVFIHVSAGFIDPGFHGKITLEIYNASERMIKLTSGIKICQVAFEKLSTICEKPYGSEGLGSHYQGQTEVTASRYGI